MYLERQFAIGLFNLGFVARLGQAEDTVMGSTTTLPRRQDLFDNAHLLFRIGPAVGPGLVRRIARCRCRSYGCGGGRRSIRRSATATTATATAILLLFQNFRL
jgi:hypothetical protein